MPSILPVGITDFTKRFFTANVTMKDRANLFATSGAIENGFPLFTEGPGGALGHAFGSWDGLVGLASLALFFLPVTHPIGAAIFALAVGTGAIRAAQYGWNTLTSAASFDLMGILTNGFATFAYAVSALPIGRLFRTGIKPTIAAIQRMAKFGAPQGEATVGRYILAGAQNLYGRDLRLGLQAFPSYARNVGQNVSTRVGQFAGTTSSTGRAATTATAEAEAALALG